RIESDHSFIQEGAHDILASTAGQGPASRSLGESVPLLSLDDLRGAVCARAQSYLHSRTAMKSSDRFLEHNITQENVRIHQRPLRRRDRLIAQRRWRKARHPPIGGRLVLLRPRANRSTDAGVM